MLKLFSSFPCTLELSASLPLRALSEIDRTVSLLIVLQESLREFVHLFCPVFSDFLFLIACLLSPLVVCRAVFGKEKRIGSH